MFTLMMSLMFSPWVDHQIPAVPPSPPPAAAAPTVNPTRAATPAGSAPPAVVTVVAPTLAPHFTVLLAPCQGAGDPLALGPRLRDVVAQRLLETGVVIMVPEPVGEPRWLELASRQDAQSLANAASMAHAEKTVCVNLQGPPAGIALQWVDAASGMVGWSNWLPFDGSEAAAAQASVTLSSQLADFVKGAHAARAKTLATAAAAGQPSPGTLKPAPAPLTKAGLPPPAPFFNAWRGAGTALMATGAMLLPAALGGILLSGAGHVGGNQLALTLPGEKAPRFFSPVFTLTWGDVVAATLLGIMGTALMGAGAVLFVVPWLRDR